MADSSRDYPWCWPNAALLLTALPTASLGDCGLFSILPQQSDPPSSPFPPPIWAFCLISLSQFEKGWANQSLPEQLTRFWFISSTQSKWGRADSTYRIPPESQRVTSVSAQGKFRDLQLTLLPFLLEGSPLYNLHAGTVPPALPSLCQHLSKHRELMPSSIVIIITQGPGETDKRINSCGKEIQPNLNKEPVFLPIPTLFSLRLQKKKKKN